MEFVQTSGPEKGIETLTQRLVSELKSGRKVLWLISGGSNIPIAVAIRSLLGIALSADELKNLTVTLTDERFGPVGHKDSNWKQLQDSGFDFTNINAVEVLSAVSEVRPPQTTLEETVKVFSQKVRDLFHEADIIIAQFGIGTDGHIAGILPRTPAVKSTASACGYISKPFTRITLTPKSIQEIDEAYVFAFGETKKLPLENLKLDLDLIDEPAQVLKTIDKVSIFSDIQSPSFL